MPSWAGDEVLKQRSIYIKKKKKACCGRPRKIGFI